MDILMLRLKNCIKDEKTNEIVDLDGDLVRIFVNHIKTYKEVDVFIPFTVKPHLLRWGYKVRYF